MAATNYTPIQLYHSTTASAVPLAANLVQGELAINITDGKLYYEDNGGVVQVIATKGAGTIGGSTTQIQYNNAGALAGNAAMTFNSGTSTTTLTTLNLTNALGAIYGGTAQSAYTQGDVLYASATNTLAKLGIGVVNYILTSTGSVPQWVAPTSITVNTATNLAGGLAGSVPYQSALDTTTFLAIGAANRVMTSTGSAPQWVTSLTGLTGVSSSSITNTSLTSGRVVISSTAGLEADSANLTFNGTTLSTTGLSNTGFSTLVKTLTLGDSSFNGAAVFAPATPAKLYLGTGTVTDVTSAASATNTTGAIASLAITPIAATNTSVTYTNASTLYIAGAPSAGTNITITNPYSLYIAAGASYFGGLVTATGFSGPLNGTVGATTPTTGAFTTVSATGLVSGSNGWFTGRDAPSSGTGVEVFSAGGNGQLLGYNRTGAAYVPLVYDASNHTFNISGTTVAAVSSTGLAITGTLSATGGVTLSGGTANGVAYLNGSKVLTTGSALTFDGTNFKTTGYAKAGGFTVAAGTLTAFDAASGGLYGYYSSGGVLASYSDNSGTLSPLNFDGSYLAWRPAGTEQMRLTSTGLGIGTSSPAYKLDVAGFVNTSAGYTVGGFTVGGYLALASNSTNLWIGDILNNFGSGVAFYSGGAERMRLDSSGNLGIGTSSPAAKLDVFKASYVDQYWRTGVVNTYLASDDSQAKAIFGTITTHPLTFYTNGAEKMRLDASGNLGIGTSSPLTKLHLQDNAAVFIQMTDVGDGASRIGQNGTALTFGVDSGNGTTERMRLDASGNLGLGVTPSAWTGGFKALQMPGGSVASYASGTNLQIEIGSAYYQSSLGAYAYFNTGTAPTLYRQLNGQHNWNIAPSGTAGNAITFTQAMTLTADGVLLIGQTATKTDEYLRVSNSGQASMLLDNTGKNNGAFLGVFNDAALFGVNRNPSSGIFYDTSKYATDIVAVGSSTDSYIVFETSSAANTIPTERMRLDASGNLLVGLTSATGVAKLQVSGAIRTTGFTVATLPAGTVGMRTYVTDALAPSFSATVVGGGAVTIPVFYNGTNWIVA